WNEGVSDPAMRGRERLPNCEHVVGLLGLRRSGAPPLLRRWGPKGGVLEVHVQRLRSDLEEGTSSLSERTDAIDWRLRRIESGHGALRRALDRIDGRLNDHIERQDKIEAATGKTLTGLKSSIEGLSELFVLRSGR
ncbi:MAG: hypothetical protein JW955_23940, partial [Sedimentisphaerales bacterium]|nr:hypothetical protein [Sedimentisphaerales bacterium]